MVPVREQRNRIKCPPECTVQKKGEPSTMEAFDGEGAVKELLPVAVRFGTVLVILSLCFQNTLNLFWYKISTYLFYRVSILVLLNFFQGDEIF